MGDLENLMKEAGARVEYETEEIRLEGLATIVDQLKRIADANEAISKRRHTELVAAIEQMADAITRVDVPKADLGPLVAAVKALKQEVVIPPATPVTYELEIERDQRQLMKRAVFVPVSKDIH